MTLLPLRAAALALPLLLLAQPALAASLSGTAFGAGYAVPLFALVHLLGLIALGLWAGEQGGVDAGRIPLVALAAAALFALLWLLGIRIPYTALVLEGSLLVLGGLVLVGTALPLALGIVLAAIAGAAQGVHLASSLSGNAPALSWLGLVADTMLALAAGVGLSALLREMGSRAAARATGGALAVVGILMLVNVL